MHPVTGWLPILTGSKQMKSLKINERITLKQVTRIYHSFRSTQLHFIISKLILSIHVIYQKWGIIIFQIWIFDEMRDSQNVSKIGLIFSAQSKSACGGLVSSIGSDNGLAPTRRQAILSEPRMVSLLTHICVTWPQWLIYSPVNTKISVWSN